MTTEILIFPGFIQFFSILSTFHDFSMTGKNPIIFQGFAGAVGKLFQTSISQSNEAIRNIKRGEDHIFHTEIFRLKARQLF